jgi:membrane-associated phospholipid phosphatase
MKFMIRVARKLLLLFCILCSITSISQKPDTLVKKLDSLSNKTDSAGGQKNNINRNAYNEQTKINVPTYFILLGSDFKQQFSKPFHMTRRDWGILGKFGLITGALIFADEPIQRFALDLQTHNEGLKNISNFITNFGGTYETYTLAALGAYGFIFKSQKVKTTTLLASQSYITAGAISTVIKFMTGRQRPYAFDPNKVETEPTFHGPFYKTIRDENGKKLNGSFPSGHTTAAFSAATVFALEYKDRPWVPILAYSAASLIGLSRMTENKHWATDVLVGAALGYLTGHQVVNNYHRYAKLKAPKQPKNTVSFGMEYEHGILMPQMVLHFKS